MKNKKYSKAYLAPLNFDRFFKKVFSDTNIAKHFIEDFLDIEIQSIQPYNSGKKRLTDNAQIVEFDYRCKIDGKEVIIDMQQWYKQDIVYRFYIYHCLNTVLQLEDLPLKKVLVDKSKPEYKEINSYDTVLPVVTIIWLVDDTLNNSKNDYLSFTLLPEKAKDFFMQTNVWQHKDIEEQVKEIVTLLKNNNKNLQFLQKNRLMFVFQKNIVKNPKIARYSHWFDFAEKTKKTENKKSDFTDFIQHPVMKEVMRRLLCSNLTDADLDYINNEVENKEAMARYDESRVREAENDGIEAVRIEKNKREEAELKMQKAEKEKHEEKVKRNKAEQEKKQAEIDSKILKLKFINKLDNETIAKKLKITIQYIEKILNI